MFVWSRTVRHNELVLREIFEVVENCGSRNQRRARYMPSIVRRLISNVDDKHFVVLYQFGKFGSGYTSCAICIRRLGAHGRCALTGSSVCFVSGVTANED